MICQSRRISLRTIFNFCHSLFREGQTICHTNCTLPHYCSCIFFDKPIANLFSFFRIVILFLDSVSTACSLIKFYVVRTMFLSFFNLDFLCFFSRFYLSYIPIRLWCGRFPKISELLVGILSRKQYRFFPPSSSMGSRERKRPSVGE